MRHLAIKLGFFSVMALAASSFGVNRNVNAGETYFGGQEQTPHVPWTFPGINISSPVGYGANWGNVAVGAGYQSRVRYATDAADGSIGFGFGAGDAAKYVGLETSIAILSVSGNDAFERGSMSFKLHRQLPAGFAVAFGRENSIIWGGTDGGRSWYGTLTKVFVLKDPTEWFSAMTLNFGLGDGRFRREADFKAGKDVIAPFASVSMRIQQPVALIADWSGQDLNLGLSITPIRNLGLYINPSIVDLTHSAGDGARFVLGVGFGYSFI